MRSRTAGKRVDREEAVARQSVNVTVSSQSLGKDLAERVAGHGKLLLYFDSNHDLMGGNFVHDFFALAHTQRVHFAWKPLQLQQRDLLVHVN